MPVSVKLAIDSFLHCYKSKVTVKYHFSTIKFHTAYSMRQLQNIFHQLPSQNSNNKNSFKYVKDYLNPLILYIFFQNIYVLFIKETEWRILKKKKRLEIFFFDRVRYFRQLLLNALTFRKLQISQ